LKRRKGIQLNLPLNDPCNSWIEKIDKDWTGAIATLIFNKEKREYEINRFIMKH
jgi:hypothetical protein